MTARFTRSVLLVLFFLQNKSLLAEHCKPGHTGGIGEVSALIACINKANAATSDTVIDLGGAAFTLRGDTLFAADGDNGLPDITNAINNIIIKNGSIERSYLADTPNFRILHVATGAKLILSELTLGNGKISNSTNPSQDNGGAIYNLGSLSLERCTLSNNMAKNLGGAIFNTGWGEVVKIKNSTISGNRALDSSEKNGGGGGIYNNSIIRNITKTTISGNITAGYGAGINNHGLIQSIFDTTISDNEALTEITGGSAATAAGGGIYNGHKASLVLLVNSTIASNTAYEGAGIYNNGEIGISNSTIARNNAYNGGGGIYNNNHGIISRLISSIVASNIDTEAIPVSSPDIYDLGQISKESFNLIGNYTGVGSIISGNNNDLVGFNPRLGPLQNNGGPTFTMALLPGSLAINNGNNPLNLEWDQRGPSFIRVANARADIGAYELQGCTDTDCDGICNADDNCPSISNIDQLDSDSDLIGDKCDRCPFVYNPDQQDP